MHNEEQERIKRVRQKIAKQVSRRMNIKNSQQINVKSWEITEMSRLEDIKQQLQRLQIEKNLNNNFDALLLLLIRRNVL